MEVNLQLQLVALDASVHKSQILRDNLIENEASNGRLYNTGLSVPSGICLVILTLPLEWALPPCSRKPGLPRSRS